MPRDFRVDYLGTERLQPAERAFLVGFDEARVAGDIGREDRREPTFDAGLPCGLHGASSVAADPTPASAQRALSMRAALSARHLCFKIEAYLVRHDARAKTGSGGRSA